MHSYPTAAALAAMGATLTRDVTLWSARLEREYRDERAADASSLVSAPRPHTRNHDKRRTYKSRYVGVTEHRNRWVAQWGPRGCVKSAVYPKTAEGELAAAWERARVLGLPEPEVRE